MLKTPEYLICGGCFGPIFEGDQILILDFDEGIDILTHRRIECLLKLDEIREETVSQIITVKSDSISPN